jgi:eukaryotic-like serine/threonine-protein kinase
VRPTEDPILDQLIADYLMAAERGEAPDPTEWVAGHPAHAAHLANFLADLGRFGALIDLPPLTNLIQTVSFLGTTKNESAETSEPFGGYELLSELGHGGMGTVYRAQLRGTPMIVALKQIQARHLDPATQRQFRREVEAVAGLRHPNIVPIYHVGEHDGQPYFTMALVEGGSLDRQLDKYQSDLRAMAKLMAKTARAVHFAHQRRVLHRDLKPANILIDEAGEPHVADFGLAAKIDESGTTMQTEPAAGSLPWMAPEAIRGDTTLTTAVDVWALGVILYELLTGQRPFTGKNFPEMRKSILETEPRSPRKIKPSLPRDLEAICNRCLCKNPDQRYESATALAIELDRWLRDEPVRARKASRGERFARWGRRNPFLAGSLAILLVSLIALTAAGISTIGRMGDELAVAVCRSNQYIARQVSVIVQDRFKQIGRAVLDTADDPELHQACLKMDRDKIQLLLRRRMQGAAEGLVRNAFVVDPSGILRASSDTNSTSIDKDFSGRDYFRIPMARAPLDGFNRVHLSRVFPSQNDQLDKLAVAAAFQPEVDAEPWVLVATVTTDVTVGQDDLPTDNLKAVLIAPIDSSPPRPGAKAQPDAFVIMAHPAYKQGEQSVRFPPNRPIPIEPAEDQGPEFRRPLPDPPFPAETDYQDPVAENGHPEYQGRWLTGSARVGNSELVVLVQQRYDQAVTPYAGIFERFLAWVSGLLALGGLGFLIVLAVRKKQASED